MDKFTVARFDGQDFSLWKFQMETYFLANGLMGVIDGSKVRPTSGDTTAWEALENKARMAIVLSLERKQLEPLISCASSKAMWDRLIVLHERATASSIFQATQEFYELKMGPEDTIVQHIARVEAAAHKLTRLKEPVTDNQIMVKVLQSLPEKYMSVVVAWNTVDAAKRNLTELTDWLLQAESVGKSYAKPSELVEVKKESDAMFARTQNFARRDFTPKSNPRSSPQSPRPSSESTDDRRRKIKCHRCGGVGHFQKVCPSPQGREEENQNAEGNVAVASSPVKTSESVAFTAESSFASKNLKSWCLDTGCSDHMSPFRGLFSNFKAVAPGRVITVGNSSKLAVRGVGDIVARAQIGNNYQSVTLRNVLYVPQLNKNLLSLGRASDRGLRTELSRNACVLKKNGKVLVKGRRAPGGVYYAVLSAQVPAEVNCAIAEPNLNVPLRIPSRTQMAKPNKIETRNFVSPVTTSMEEQNGKARKVTKPARRSRPKKKSQIVKTRTAVGLECPRMEEPCGEVNALAKPLRCSRPPSTSATSMSHPETCGDVNGRHSLAALEEHANVKFPRTRLEEPSRFWFKGHRQVLACDDLKLLSSLIKDRKSALHICLLID